MKLANRILIAILILAAVLRLYNIDDNPPSVYGDEISFAWNAWSILKTGADEFGVSYPLQFRAFEDYKAPVPVYLLVPFLKFLGMNSFSVRLPVALASVLTVWATYILTKELFVKLSQKKPHQAETIALMTAALMSISPWHVHLSRGFFESTLALLPFILGLYFFIKGLDKAKHVYISSALFGLSLYIYFTPRMTLICFIPFLFLFFRKQVLKQKKTFIYAGVLLLIMSLPLVKLTLFDQGGSRLKKLVQNRIQIAAKETTLDLSSAQGPLWLRKILHNRYRTYLSHITNDYLEHFSINFWYVYGDNSLRYFLGKMGMFYLVEFPFLIIGLYYLFRDQTKIAWLLLGWLLIAPIPAAIAGRPFSIRSLAMLPAPFIIVSFGLYRADRWVKSTRKRLLSLARLIVLLLFIWGLFTYLSRYHFDYPVYAATWWGWENKAAIDYARERENDYNQIFLSDFYTGMPLAFAFYHQVDAAEYRQARDNPVIIEGDKRAIKFGKYYIGSLDIDKKRLKAGKMPSQTLYIGRPEEADSPENIVAPVDGRILFKIHRTD